VFNKIYCKKCQNYLGDHDCDNCSYCFTDDQSPELVKEFKDEYLDQKQIDVDNKTTKNYSGA